MTRATLVREGDGDTPLTVEVPDDRAWEVRAVPVGDAAPTGGPWGAASFARLAGDEGTPIEVAREGRRLRWTPQPGFASVIVPA